MDRPRKVQLYFAGPVCYILLRRAVSRQQNGAAVHKRVVLQAFGAVCGQVNRFSVVAKPGKVGAKVGGSLSQPTTAF